MLKKTKQLLRLFGLVKQLKKLPQSEGVKRTLASLLAVAAVAAAYFPALLPYRELLISLAGIMGGFGSAHALLDKAQKLLKDAEK